MRYWNNVLLILKVIKTLSRGEAMIAQVDVNLKKGKQSETENQQMSDFIEEKTAAFIDKVLLRASNLIVNHYSVATSISDSV